MRRILAVVDGFTLLLIAAIVLASAAPPAGAMARTVETLADIAVILLFFLHGARLQREAVVAGVLHWRLHLTVLAASFLLFPALGLAIRPLADWAAPHATFGAGLLFLCCLPSTVQSSIAFTALARGNVPAAVCSASLSNLLGIVITPVLVGLFMHVAAAGNGVSLSAIKGIMLQLLLPFVAGHLLRPLIGGFVDRNKRILMPVDRSSILLVVYTAFSAAVIGGIWQRTSLWDLAAILMMSALMLALVMGTNLFVARRIGLAREDEIVLLFCGSKKSLVSGVPMAGALFHAAAGPLILPLMIFHQLQLFLCAIIAARYRSMADDAPVVRAPRVEDVV